LITTQRWYRECNCAYCDGQGVHTREGDRVHFRVSSVFLPSAGEVSTRLAETEELEGTILSFSDSGDQPRAFAVIEVVRKVTVVVPVSELQSAGLNESETGSL